MQSRSFRSKGFLFLVVTLRKNYGSDTYTCPANETPTTNGNWYAKKNGTSISQMKHYKSSACLSCELLKNAPKMPKAVSLNASNMPILFIKIKSESKIIIKYTADDKPSSNIRQPVPLFARE
ncbi:hypothetical protein EKL32_11695 [Flavobacterium sp. GSN2]|nr:hypothetical protein EKL32_11695 [Flavobacterium sp. GSN2]